MTRSTSPCPIDRTVNLIGSRWKLLIIRDLRRGTKRFGELKNSLTGVSAKVLSAQLKELEKDRLVSRTAYLEIPPRVEYELTETGRSLEPILDSMLIWGEQYKR